MIPVNEPSLGEKELQFVNECIATGWISSTGKFIDEFESQWARYCGMQHGIAVSNGTVALEVAVQCLNLQPDDEIIMPTFTIISCALGIVYNKCKPVLVDSEPKTWTMDTTKIEEKITNRTKAIMPVHIYGHPCYMDTIQQLAAKYNLKIIEDAAEAHGAEYKNKRCGGLGDISCFSFYANKIITTGEGGMILTNSDIYAERARSIRNLCFKKERRFFHTELGNNFRLTNVQAAIGLAQLERIDSFIKKKRWMAAEYRNRLHSIKELILPVEESWATNVYWMFGIVLDDTVDFDAIEFAKRLHKEGVETRPFFLGMHEQPVFLEMKLFKDERYPVAEKIARRGLYLPSGMTLNEQQIETVSEAVKRSIR